MGYRDFYNKDLNYFIEDSKKIYTDEYFILRDAKQQLRMYANLYNRDMRKTLINENSSCAYCGIKYKLTIDHIKPVIKGGKNELSNLQILCSYCNNKKRDNE